MTALACGDPIVTSALAAMRDDVVVVGDTSFRADVHSLELDECSGVVLALRPDVGDPAIVALSVASAAHDMGARVVLVSSCASYGSDRRRFVTETSRPQPSDTFGRACLAAEEYVRDECVNSVVLRASTVYAEGQRLTWYEEGLFDLLRADDLARAIDTALTREGVEGEVINVCSGHSNALAPAGTPLRFFRGLPHRAASVLEWRPEAPLVRLG